MKRLLFITVLLFFSRPVFATVTCNFCYSSVIAAGGDSTGSCANTPWDDSIDSVMTTLAAGNHCVADNHAEASTSTLTITGPVAEGTNDFARVICVDVSSCAAEVCDPCGVGEEATVTVTTSGQDIQFEGKLYLFRIGWLAGDEILISQNVDAEQIFQFNTFELTSSSGTDNIVVGESNAWGQNIKFYDSDFTFGAVGQGFEITHARMIWDGGTLDTNINTLFETLEVRQSVVEVRNVDLSILTGNVITASSMDAVSSSFYLSTSKLHASTTLFSGTIDVPGVRALFSFNESGTVSDPYWQKAEYHYQGEINASATNVMTGGTSKSWEFDTNGSNFLEGYEGLCSEEWIGAYVSGGSELTLAVHFNGASALNVGDIWVDWSLPSENADTLGVRESSKGEPGETTSLTAGGATWTSGTSYKSTTTFTPAEDGIVQARLCVATLTSSTKVYLNPQISIE